MLISDNSVQRLQESLALYRRLLSLIKTQRSEPELIRTVVNSLWEQYPEYRVVYGQVEPNADFHIIYSREPDSLPSMTGLRATWNAAPEYLAELKTKKILVIPDIRNEPKLAPIAEAIEKVAGSRSRIDCPLPFEDGNIGYLSISHALPRNWDPHLVATIQEVAELIHLILREAHVQERLKRSETVFRQFAEHIPSVFWMTDPTKNQMVYISPGYETIWGRTCESLYKNPLSFLDSLHSQDRNRIAAAIQNQADGTYDEVYRVVRPDGSIRWVKDRGYPVKNEAGEVYRVVGVAEDITALKEAKHELERTQAQVIAKAKFAALGEMASGMAHEINNPLAVIHGLTRQLKEVCTRQREDSVVVRESLDTIEKMCNRIAGLVKGMRTFSRQTDHDPLVLSELGPIVRETVAMCTAKYRSTGVEVELKLQPADVFVRCRPSELSQVLLNLLNNAYDAIERSEEKWIRLAVSKHPGKTLITVEDSGRGISNQARERLFQPFFTTKEVGRGTGLGLSISKGIIEAHGGFMYLDTSTQQTRFVVELPGG